ncbi:MAG: hypothetical protein ACREL6_00145 [Gemmatimonadales bacterium]
MEFDAVSRYLKEPSMLPRFRGLILGAGVIAGLAAVATPALAGPSWISIELPANPHDASSRGAYLLIHAYHHGDNISMLPTGTAEGLVDGERRSVRLDIRRTSRPGVFAVRYEPATSGTWMLVLHAGEDGNMASAIVPVSASGSVAGVNVPSRQDGRWTVPVPVTQGQVDALLARQAAMVGENGADDALFAGLGLLALVPAGLLIRRRLTLQA